MSKQKCKKVTVKLKNIRDGNEWHYKNIHQMTLSEKLMVRLRNGEKLRLMTLHPPKHTAKTLLDKKNLQDLRKKG